MTLTIETETSLGHLPPVMRQDNQHPLTKPQMTSLRESGKYEGCDHCTGKNKAKQGENETQWFAPATPFPIRRFVKYSSEKFDRTYFLIFSFSFPSGRKIFSQFCSLESSEIVQSNRPRLLNLSESHRIDSNNGDVLQSALPHSWWLMMLTSVVGSTYDRFQIPHRSDGAAEQSNRTCRFIDASDLMEKITTDRFYHENYRLDLSVWSNVDV